MNSYPTTISNGHGEQLTFVGRRMQDGIEYLDVENLVSPGGGPPMHVHHIQDEGLTVVEGTLAYQLMGQEVKYLNAGESAVFKRGEIHRFWNAGTTMLKCTGWVSPAYNLEYFLTEMYRSTEQNNGRPGTFDAAYLLDRYKTEFDMYAIPSFVKKVIFPISLIAGKAAGKHKKVQNAPSAIPA